MQPALEQAFADLVLGHGPESSDADSVHAWLTRQGLSAPDAAAISRAPPERLLIYRNLVRQTLKRTLRLAIPRSIDRLGSRFETLFDRFLREAPPRSRYLRDVTVEFIRFMGSLQPEPNIPDYLSELMQHESLRIEIGALPARFDAGPAAPLHLDHPVVFIPACRVVRYAYAVHRLPEAPADRSEPEAAPTALFVYRSPDHEVRYLELSPLAARILENLLDRGACLREAVTLACAELGLRVDKQLLEATANLLADLADRGALLGARAASD